MVVVPIFLSTSVNMYLAYAININSNHISSLVMVMSVINVKKLLELNSFSFYLMMQ